MTSARETALLALYKIEYEGAYSNLALKNCLAAAKLSPKDAGLASALVYGVIQRKNTLLYVISRLSNLKLKKLSGYITLILELGIYQLLYMDKIPESAAVNESVKLARRYGHAKSAGFVNAVLRNVIRNGFDYPKDKINALCVKYSFPEWIVKKWIRTFGEDFAQELMQASNEVPPLTLRVNTLKTTRENIQKSLPGSSKGRYSDYALYSPGFDIENS